MTWLAVAIALLTGLLLLLAWFFPLAPLEGLRWLLLHTTMVLSGLILLAAFGFLLHTQWQAVRRRAAHWPYRGLMVLAALTTFALTAFLGTQSIGPWMWAYVLVPGSAALLGLLAVVLTYRGLWMVWQRRDPMGWLFLGVLFLVMLLDAWQALGSPPAWSRQLMTWMESVVVRAGVRGLLLGLALGLVLVGLRVLSGAERPFEG